MTDEEITEAERAFAIAPAFSRRIVARLAAEIRSLRSAIETHRSQKADDRCIEDDDRLYAALGDGVKCDRRVGDKDAMLANCRRFIERRCDGGGWPTYAELEKSLAAKDAEVGELQGGQILNRNAIKRLQDEKAALEAALADARFRPLGDNHHNAAMCPYCQPTIEKDRARWTDEIALQRKRASDLLGQLQAINSVVDSALGVHGMPTALEGVRRMDAEIEKLTITSDSYKSAFEEMVVERNAAEKSKAAAYSERDRCVAAFATLAEALGWPVWLGVHVGEWDADWRGIVYVQTPHGQVSWHYHDSERELFAMHGGPKHAEWDGHSTAVKYERLWAMGHDGVVKSENSADK